MRDQKSVDLMQLHLDAGMRAMPDFADEIFPELPKYVCDHCDDKGFYYPANSEYARTCEKCSV
jgi:hypothetical protein